MFNLFACCLRTRPKKPDPEIPDETSRLIPASTEISPPLSPHVAVIDQERLKDRLGTIIRAKEGKMVNVNAAVPFNLHNQRLSQIDPSSSSRSASSSNSRNASQHYQHGASHSNSHLPFSNLGQPHHVHYAQPSLQPQQQQQQQQAHQPGFTPTGGRSPTRRRRSSNSIERSPSSSSLSSLPEGHRQQTSGGSRRGSTVLNVRLVVDRDRGRVGESGRGRARGRSALSRGEVSEDDASAVGGGGGGGGSEQAVPAVAASGDKEEQLGDKNDDETQKTSEEPKGFVIRDPGGLSVSWDD